MGMTRLSSDGSLPQSDFSYASVAFTTLNYQTQQRLAAPSTKVQRAVLRAHVNNSAPIDIYPTGVDTFPFCRLQPGDEYVIAAQPGTRFDLSKWWAVGVNSANVTLHVVYQP
jgi:hypothetical protein